MSRPERWSASTLQCVSLAWAPRSCRALGALPSPLWGGVGGGGHEIGTNIAERATPLPSPPPQGGREHTAFAARADPIATGYALVRRASLDRIPDILNPVELDVSAR